MGYTDPEPNKAYPLRSRYDHALFYDSFDPDVVSTAYLVRKIENRFNLYEIAIDPTSSAGDTACFDPLHQAWII